MEKILLVTFAILALAYGQEQPVLNCFFCESKAETDCYNKPEEVLRVPCNQLDYGFQHNHNATPTTRHINSGLSDIFKRESSRFAVGNENIEYKCIQITLKEDRSDNFIRTCAPLRNNIESACDYIREQSEPYAIKDCNECHGDFCNSAFSLSSGLILQFASAAVAWFLINL